MFVKLVFIRFTCHLKICLLRTFVLNSTFVSWKILFYSTSLSYKICVIHCCTLRQTSVYYSSRQPTFDTHFLVMLKVIMLLSNFFFHSFIRCNPFHRNHKCSWVANNNVKGSDAKSKPLQEKNPLKWYPSIIHHHQDDFFPHRLLLSSTYSSYHFCSLPLPPFSQLSCKLCMMMILRYCADSLFTFTLLTWILNDSGSSLSLLSSSQSRSLEVARYKMLIWDDANWNLY